MYISAISSSKINFNSYSSKENFVKKSLECCSFKTDLLSFGSLYAESEIKSKQILSEKRRESIKKIDDNEYKEIMNYLLENKSDLNNRYVSNNYFIDTSYCDNIPFEFMGVIPYCGVEDCSKHINDFITGKEKLSSQESEKNNARFISALNYSLDKIDEKYGKYEGIVYRKGQFNPNLSRYYSASETADIDSYIYCNLDRDFARHKKIDLNIIKLKNGHKINSMLYEYAYKNLKKLALSEDEILIDTKSKFKKVEETEYTDEILKIKNSYFDVVTKKLRKKYSPKELKNKINISVWEEV